MKIDAYWDLRSTIPHRHTGVGKHIIEVIRGMLAEPSIDLRIWVASDQHELWQEQSAAFGWSALPVVKLPFSNKVGRLLAGLGLSFSAKRLCAGRDLVYSPMEILAPIKGIPCVNTVHGIPYFEKSPFFTDANYNTWGYRYERLKQRWFFRCCRRRCAASFVVSDYLKEKLIQDFGWPTSKLHTVYNGADALFFETSHKATDNNACKTQPIHLLQVGGANAFDGAPALLAVANYLATAHPELTIRIAGDRHESPWEKQLRQLPNTEWLGFLCSQALRDEMIQASALLYLPAAESFGIIGVEAMAVGLPIIALRSTALPEVLGEAAVWIEPQDPESIEKGLRTACLDETHRQQLITLGKTRAQRYQWQSVRERVIAKLSKMLKS